MRSLWYLICLVTLAVTFVALGVVAYKAVFRDDPASMMFWLYVSFGSTAVCFIAYGLLGAFEAWRGDASSARPSPSSEPPQYDVARKNDTKYILTRLQECTNSEQEMQLLNALLDGPKFMVFFDNADDAQKFAAKIPYANREGTITYGRPISDGVYVFTGGRISGDEALAVYSAIRAPDSNQKRAIFYDWDPPAV